MNEVREKRAFLVRYNNITVYTFRCYYYLYDIEKEKIEVGREEDSAVDKRKSQK